MYSAARVNQFEMKDTCIEFVIVSSQGSKVKIKLHLNINLQRQTAVLIFCEINDNTPGFCLVLSGAYS